MMAEIRNRSLMRRVEAQTHGVHERREQLLALRAELRERGVDLLAGGRREQHLRVVERRRALVLLQRRRQIGLHRRGELVVQDGAEHGEADGAADRAEELQAGRDLAEPVRWVLVLHDHREGAHADAHAEAHDDHVACEGRPRGVEAHAREQVRARRRRTKPTMTTTLYLPVRARICPEPMLLTIAPSISGMRMMPELVADLPSTPWTKRGRNMMAPNMAADLQGRRPRPRP